MSAGRRSTIVAHASYEASKPSRPASLSAVLSEEVVTGGGRAVPDLQEAMLGEHTPGQLDGLFAASFVHKLTWRPKVARPGPDTVLAELMRTRRPSE